MAVIRVLLSVALLVISAVPARAEEALFEFKRLRGIPLAGVEIRGIPGGGVPWTIARGEARLDEDGRLRVRVEGLVVAATGTNPVPQFFATLSCLNADGTINNIDTQPVPATSTGDARIEEVLVIPISWIAVLPDACLGPIVFVRGIVPALGNPWFAISGF